jgi:hypothetical protein
MQIPPEAAIKATIRPGSVYYFPEESFTTSEPHYFIVVNKDPFTEELVILVCASSKIEAVRKRRKSCPPETVIEIGPKHYPELRVDSIIDCNYVLEKSIDQLVTKMKTGQLKLKTEMNISIVERLRQGILSSPVIEKRIKDRLR